MRLKKNGEPFKKPVRKPMSLSQKQSISKSKQGKRTTGTLGKIRSKEEKDKISNSLIGKKWKQKSSVKKILPQSHKDKISLSVKEYIENLSEEERAKRISKWTSSNITEDTKPEKIFEEMLISKNIEFEKQKWIKGKYRVDFYLPEHNLIVEIFGCYWHGCSQCGYEKNPNNFDDVRREFIESLGYKFKIIWEHQLKSFT